MVFTNPQTTAFFTDAAQMALEARTRVFLATEGITTVDDLKEFTTSESWKQILENAKYPPQIADPANPGHMIAQAPFRISAKSLIRLKVAALAVAYYEDTSRPLTAAGMQWEPRLRSFKAQWEAIKDLKESDDMDLPKIGKNVGVVKWLEAYANYAGQKIGARGAPRALVIRDNAAVAGTPPALAPNEPHSTEHGSVMEEMTQRFSHNHALYRTDNSAVFDDIEAATRGTKYASSIAPHKSPFKDGRGAFMSIKSQHAGPAMWDAEYKTQNDFIINRDFTGGTSLTLERYLSQHRQAHTAMQRCAENIQCQVPDQRTRVGYLIENIKCADSDVKAAIAAIKLDDNPTGLRNDFERAVALLIPCDPVAKKRKGKRPIADVAAANATVASASGGGLKSGIGKTGVSLRYHKPTEYAKLNKEQRTELREWRSKQRESGANLADTRTKKPDAKKLRASIQSVLKEMQAEDKKKEDNLAEIKSVLSALAGNVTDGKAQISGTEAISSKRSKTSGTNPDAAEIAAVKLQKIMHTMQDSKLNGGSNKKSS